MKSKYLIFLVIVLLVVTGCSQTLEPTEEPVAIETEPTQTIEPTDELMTFTDDLGRIVTLSDYPSAIISISPSTTEILFAIGAGNQVVGRDDMSLFPEEALNVSSIGSLWGGIPTETILSLEPDLILAAEIISEEQVQSLADLGLQVYWQANPDDYEGLFDNLKEIASLTGHQHEVEILVKDLRTRVEIVKENITGASFVPSVFYELDATDPVNPWTAGSGTFIDYIIRMAGGKNAAAHLQGDYIQISTEEIINVNPNLILLADALYGISKESVEERPGWDSIQAVINGEIYPIDPNIMSVPGPRLVDALEETAKIFHPELFN